jgi:hypothetical protein
VAGVEGVLWEVAVSGLCTLCSRLYQEILCLADLGVPGALDGAAGGQGDDVGQGVEAVGDVGDGGGLGTLLDELGRAAVGVPGRFLGDVVEVLGCGGVVGLVGQGRGQLAGREARDPVPHRAVPVAGVDDGTAVGVGDGVDAAAPLEVGNGGGGRGLGDVGVGLADAAGDATGAELDAVDARLCQPAEAVVAKGDRAAKGVEGLGDEAVVVVPEGQAAGMADLAVNAVGLADLPKGPVGEPVAVDLGALPLARAPPVPGAGRVAVVVVLDPRSVRHPQVPAAGLLLEHAGVTPGGEGKLGGRRVPWAVAKDEAVPARGVQVDSFVRVEAEPGQAGEEPAVVAEHRREGRELVRDVAFAQCERGRRTKRYVE